MPSERAHDVAEGRPTISLVRTEPGMEAIVPFSFDSAASSLVTRRQMVFGPPDIATARLDSVIAKLREPLVVRSAIGP